MDERVCRRGLPCGRAHAAPRRRAQLLALASLAALLAACGGGGGGGGGGLSMSLTPHDLSVHATPGQPAPTASVTVTLSSAPATGQDVYIDTHFSENGLASISFQGSSQTQATLLLTFIDPATLAPGTYTDSLQVQACFDQACTRPIGNSPQTVTTTYQVTSGDPSLTAINPPSVLAGSPGFSLTVNGSGFDRGSTVQWNGAARPTTYVSASQLTALISTADVATTGSASVSVSNAAGGGGVSGALPFTIQAPPPLAVTGIAPASATAGSPGLVLTVTGTGFGASSTVLWNGSARPTSYVSATQLTAQIATADLATAGTVAIAVSNGGTAVPSPVSFTIVPIGALSLSALSPSSIAAGGAGFTLAVTGTGFVAGSVVQWNGAALPTTWLSASALQAQVPAADVAAAGSASVTVANPAGQGGTSNALPFKVTPAGIDAVAFQLNPAHTGAITFQNVSLPSQPTWSVDVGGTPSYAVIAAGLVFVTVGVTGGTEILALDQANGAPVWGPIIVSGQANAAYDNGTLFVLNATIGSAGLLQALDASTGNRKWSVALTSQYWFDTPPTAADGMVYTGAAGEGGTVYAVNQTNGALVWTQSVANGSGSSPAVTATGVYVSYPCQTYDLDPASGAAVWTNSTGCDGGGGGTPVVANGVLYSPNGFGSYSGMTFDAQAGTLAGSYLADGPPAFTGTTGYYLQSGTLRAVTNANNMVQWSFAGDGTLTSSPIVVNQYVFIGSSSGMLYALDGATGQQVWAQNLGAPLPHTEGWDAGMIYSGLAAGDGLLVVPAGTKLTAYTLSTNP
ncbi:MAG TPA: PQQ-binding-like beta-propeller repeat protein [Steroidobacteraceae bacterium]|nr:PQQ-binding-like beta-propeller repeat protein [Steroidobacteraceae bacterium]